MSDCIAVMNAGRIEQAGTPEDVYLRPSTRFVAGFLGAVNWIDGAGVRPEALRLARALPADGHSYRAATVVRSVFLGNCVQVQVRLADGAGIVAETPRSEESFLAGESVYVYWQRADIDIGSTTLHEGQKLQWFTEEEIASLACFLCSDEAGWITGDRVAIDGGRALTSLR